MSEEHEFALIAESLRNQGFGRHKSPAGKLRRGMWLGVIAAGLLATAVLLALTNTLSIVITLTVVIMVVYEVVLLGVREHQKEAV
jgi:hypothetical protein